MFACRNVVEVYQICRARPDCLLRGPPHDRAGTLNFLNTKKTARTGISLRPGISQNFRDATARVTGERREERGEEKGGERRGASASTARSDGVVWVQEER